MLVLIEDKKREDQVCEGLSSIQLVYFADLLLKLPLGPGSFRVKGEVHPDIMLVLIEDKKREDQVFESLSSIQFNNNWKVF